VVNTEKCKARRPGLSPPEIAALNVGFLCFTVICNLTLKMLHRIRLNVLGVTTLILNEYRQSSKSSVSGSGSRF
jgi:hypothetical protein